MHSTRKSLIFFVLMLLSCICFIMFLSVVFDDHFDVVFADDGDDDDKVTICHIPPGNPAKAHTIKVGRPAVATHLAHGDYLGPCVDDDNAPPVADADGPYQIDLGDGITLDASASSDPDEAIGDLIVSFQWDINNDGTFGDVSGVHPTLTAATLSTFDINTSGSFEIKLQVTDTLGATGVDTSTIEVFENTPVAVASATPTTIAPGNLVTFDHSASSHQSIGHSIVLYQWDFDEDGTFDFSTADATVKPQHVYPAILNHPTRTETAVLRVTDDNSPSKTDTVTLEIIVTAANLPPVADADGPYQIDLGDGVTLDGTASFEPNEATGDSIVSYQWDIDNDGAFGDVTGVTLNLTAEELAGFGISSGGNFPIKLQVTDTFGATGVDITTIKVFENTPVAVAGATPTNAAPGDLVTFDHSASSHQSIGHNIVLYVWDFDSDGTLDFSTADASVKPQHAYPFIPGTPTRIEIAELVVVDDNSPAKTATATIEITVTFANRVPVANAGGPYQVNLGTNITLDGSASLDLDEAAGDSIVSFKWDINNDGTFDDVTGVNPTLTAASLASFGIDTVGHFLINLQVTDTFGATGVDTTTIEVVEIAPGASKLGGLSLNTRHYRDFVDRIISLMIAETGIGQLIGGEQLMALIRSNPELQEDLIGFIKNVVPPGIFPEQLILRPDLPLIFDQASNIDLENFGNGITPSPITDLLPALGVLDAGLPRLLNGDKLDLYLVATQPQAASVQFTLSGPHPQTVDAHRVEGFFPHTFHLEEEQAVLFLPSWPSLSDEMTEVFSSVTLRYATNELPQPDVFGNVPNAAPAPVHISLYTGQAALQPRLIDNQVVWETTVDLQPGKIYYYFYEVELVQPVKIELPGFPPDFTVSGWVMPDPRNLQIEDRGIVERLITPEFQQAMADILDPIIAAIATGGPFPDVTMTPEQQQTLLDIVLPEAKAIFDEIIATKDPRLSSLFRVPAANGLQSLWVATFDLGNSVDGDYQLSASVFGEDGTLINQIHGKDFTMDRMAPEADMMISIDQNAGLYQRQSDGVYVATALPPELGATSLPPATLRISAIPHGDQSDLAGYLYQMIPHEVSPREQVLAPWLPLRVESTGLGDLFIDIVEDPFGAILSPNQLGFLANLVDIAPITFEPPHQLNLVLRGENNRPPLLVGQFGLRVVGVDNILNINSNLAPILRLDIIPPETDIAEVTFVVVGDLNGDGDTSAPYESGPAEGITLRPGTTNVTLTIEILNRTVHPLVSIVVQSKPAGENALWENIMTLDAEDLVNAMSGSAFEVEWSIDNFDRLVEAGDHVMVRAVATNALSVSDPIPAIAILGIISSDSPPSSSQPTFNLPVPDGISLIHIPLKVTAVDGQAMKINTIGDFYAALGGEDNVSMITTQAHGVWQSFLGQSSRGTLADRQITADLGILTVMKNPVTLRLTGDALGENGVSQIQVMPGFNLVGVPLKSENLKRASDLLTLEGFQDKVSSIIVFENGRFKVVAQPGDEGDTVITGGQSVGVVAQGDALAKVTGVAWDNVLGNTDAAPPMTIVGHRVNRQTPVLEVHGTVVHEVTSVAQDDFYVIVKNLTTGAMLTSLSGRDTPTGNYSVTFVDADFSRAARDGDILEITAQTPSPLIGVQPRRHIVSTADVKASQIHIRDLVAYEVPSETILLSNYPNPFNPETWLPYRLAEAAFVTLTLYDVTGAVVRTIEVGHQPAAVYESRNKAIYWDGRNDSGERVATGTYFYTFSANDFTQTRKMLLLK